MKQKIQRSVGLLLFMIVAAGLVFAALYFWGENQGLQLELAELQLQVEKSVTVTSSNAEEADTQKDEGAFVLSEVDQCRKDAEELATVYYDSALSARKKGEQVEDLISEALAEDLAGEWISDPASQEEGILDFKTDHHLGQLNSYYNLLSPTVLSVMVTGTLQTNVSYMLELDGEKIPVNNNTESPVFFGVTFQQSENEWSITRIDQNLVAREETGRAPGNP